MLYRAALRRSPQQLLRAPATRRAYSSAQGGFEGAADNAFNRERAAVKQHAAETSDLWRKLSIYVVLPSLAIASANAYRLWNEHWEHEAHMPPREERPEYPYQNLRTKNFWWGDGDKTLFWNDKVNYHKKDE
ncbi:Cytochrome c oxidase subunit [Neofusicoccum parvum]|uniref:Cytochrome c oxidase subunit n=7 Tax=Neofusicoccum TaxID=407951 RepID=R1ELB6_BOTPV|nr:cytochrome c oxidase subunit VIa [Neofusicoccum cordaticola]ATA58106.1 cytochrome c oxidase subunit VIa [Neofusicoccum kwambonambiense]ATA58113.1 cytochrome c oxidase subunit VIa [Neofusicoccum parvum]ATA58120.1 cytochrome c oxidase subunit VIa [Neofusicoccum umdonicola]ATA58127.1 cytochrome c oxidase subunit VIa [Neofusicoccum ribis]EOD48563.1 putative cytochrome c oxidase subunit via protein [Neofusicoccum parvum UCRNP2]